MLLFSELSHVVRLILILTCPGLAPLEPQYRFARKEKPLRPRLDAASKLYVIAYSCAVRVVVLE